MMSHERFESLLGDYADGILPLSQLRAFGEHLGSCARCAALADSYTSALADLHSFPRLEVPAGFTASILERTTRRPSAWETFWSWMGLPRLTMSRSAAGALLSVLLLFLAGTADGRRLARELNMATHQTYSNAVRLYYRSSDIKETAASLGRKIPGQLEGTVDWIRNRLGKQPVVDPKTKEPSERPSTRLLSGDTPTA